MNRTLKEATKKDHYQSHQQMQDHIYCFVRAIMQKGSKL
jgi:hypothetical protein